MEHFATAFMLALEPINLFYCFFGTLVGAMPGLSSIMGLSIVLPFTFSAPGVSGFFMLLGVFCGSIYGGSITAILINTPGTANSAATCLDGYPMATKLGQPGRALGLSTFASLFGGLFSSIALLGTAPLLAKFAMKFGSPEYFSLAIFGLTIVTRISSKSLVKSLIGAVIGLLLATVGLDPISGAARFTFDTIYFTGGVSYVPLIIALYAFSQGLISSEESVGAAPTILQTKLTHILPRFEDVKRVFNPYYS